MAYTVFIYKDNMVINSRTFQIIQEAYSYIAELDRDKKIEKCILDDGNSILNELRRNELTGNLEPVAR